MLCFICRLAAAAMLLQITLPPEVDCWRGYNCDLISYESDGSVCVMLNITDISYWNYEINNLPINEITFSSCNINELSTTISISYSDYYGIIRIVNLSGNHIRSLKKFHFTIETLLVANLSRNEIENLETSSIFEANGRLKIIDLSFNRITSIHSEALNGLTDLEELFLNNNELKDINEFMFAPLVQLMYLDLTANVIEKLENNSFGELVNLQKLYLERNNLLEFDFDILETNNNLREISLGNGTDLLSLTGNINLATSLTISKIVQSNLTGHSKTVSITNSKISIVTIGKKVEEIVARNSSITKLIFDDESPPIRVADFSHNLLTGDLSFENWQRIEILDVSFNRLENINFANCSLLTNLNLSNNNLTFIQNMTTLSKLKILDLSFNCIANFQLNTFSTMISLEILNLQKTCFKSLDYGTFSFQTSLRVLDISFNNLNSLDLNLLSTQATLEDLFIDGNNLTDVQSLDLIGIYFPKLQSMGLTHNRWSCQTLSSLINKLHLLNIKVFVENAIQHSTNVKGIGCIATSLSLSSKETFIVPESPVSINHTMYMIKVEKINEMVKTLNELTDQKNDREIMEKDLADLQHDKSAVKSNFDDQINQFNIFGKRIVNKFQSLNDINFDKLMKMKATIVKLNETNNEKYDVMSESVNSLKDKLQLIQLNEQNYPENVNKIVKDEIKVNSDYFDDISTLKALEIFLITLLFMLFMVALYYVLVYC